MHVLTLSFVDRTGLAVPAQGIQVELNEAGTGWREPDAGHRRDFGVYFELRRAERPLPVELRITPPASSPFWPIRKRFQYDRTTLMQVASEVEQDDPDGVPVADARLSFYHLQRPDFGTSGANSVVSVGVVLSRVRDVLTRVQHELGNIPRVRLQTPRQNPDTFTVPDTYPLAWSSAPLTLPSVVQMPLIRGGSTDLRFTTPADVAPAMTEAVLEVRGGGVPALLSVSCPTELLDRVAIASRSSPQRPSLPFLVHYRPFARGAGFFDQRPGSKGYPWDWDYLFFPFWSERSYITDPIVRPKVGKGFCYQIAASGNRLALVLPLPRGSSFGRMIDPAWLESMLVEIQAYLLRRRLVYAPSDQPNRVALSSLSAGAEALRDVLQRSEATHAIREAYLLDPPDFEADSITRTILGWSNRIGNTTRVRVYARFSNAVYESEGLVESTAFEQALPSPPSSLPRTYANVTTARWRRVADARGALSRWNDSNVHQLVGATMLTDALRRSDF
jgi:hypothetical protein